MQRRQLTANTVWNVSHFEVTMYDAGAGWFRQNGHTSPIHQTWRHPLTDALHVRLPFWERKPRVTSRKLTSRTYTVGPKHDPYAVETHTVRVAYSTGRTLTLSLIIDSLAETEYVEVDGVKAPVQGKTARHMWEYLTGLTLNQYVKAYERRFNRAPYDLGHFYGEA